MTNEEAWRVLREMRNRREGEVALGIHGEHGDANAVRREIVALTAALAALDGTRLKQDAERIETQRAQYAHLALKHDATEKRLTAALEDRARLRERIEALPWKETVVSKRQWIERDAVLDAIDAGEPPAWYDPHTVANATMKLGEPPKGETNV